MSAITRNVAHVKAALRRRLRDAVVLATFVPPVRRLVARLYDVALTQLAQTLAARPYVREVGLTGSLVSGDGVWGASDIDLIVIAEGGPAQEAKRDMRRLFARARRVFPFVGETDERTGNLLFSTDVGTNPAAAVYACRRKAGSYRPLVGARLEPASEAAFTPVEIVAEITLQLQAIATQTLAGALNLYFWKSKIRVLDNLLRRSGEAGARRAPAFGGAHAALLATLHDTPNHRLYFRRRAADDALAWEIVLALVDALVAAHGLDDLPSHVVAYHATPALQLEPDVRALPPGLQPHALASLPELFAGDAVLNAPVLQHLLLELTDARWEAFRAALLATRAPAAYALVLVWLGAFVFQIHRGRCRGVFSRWDRPWLFLDRMPEPGRLVFPTAFLDRLLAERDLDLDYLRDQFYWRVLDRTATDDPARHDDALRYFEDRQRSLNGFAYIHIATRLSHDAIVNFGDRDDVLADAEELHEPHRALLGRLRRYARAVEDGTLERDGTSLPPALMRAARALFADVLHGRPLATRYDDAQKLRMSVCVCTRNRADLLAALLASLAAQTRVPDEVLIIDNASTDDTPVVAARFAVRLPLRHVVDHGDTIAKVRNRALSEASGEVVCFTDDDCVLHPGWLHFIEESFLLEDDVGIVGGRVLHLEEEPSLVDGFHRAYLGVRL